MELFGMVLVGAIWMLRGPELVVPLQEQAEPDEGASDTVGRPGQRAGTDDRQAHGHCRGSRRQARTLHCTQTCESHCADGKSIKGDSKEAMRRCTTAATCGA